MSQPRLDYELLAADYAAHRRTQPALVQAIIDDGGIDGHSSVADVGCGTGNYIIAIAAATGCRTVGIEPDSAMLARARARSNAIRWLQAPAEQLHLPPASMDCMLAVDVIHHVGDRPAFFRSAVSALKRGGRLCIATDSPEILVRRRPLANYFPATIAADAARYPHPDRLTAELTACGFTRIDAREVAYAYAITDSAPYRDRAYSSLHLIPEEAFAAGLARLEEDLAAGPVDGLSLYWLITATAS